MSMRSFAKASGWMKRAGSVGLKAPDSCADCVFRPMRNWSNQVAAVHLLGDAPVAGAQHGARVLGNLIRHAHPGPDLDTLHPIDVEDSVVPPHEIHADPDICRDPWVRPPRVLNVDSDIS